MNQRIKQYIERLRGVRLTDGERARGRAVVVSFMRDHPSETSEAVQRISIRQSSYVALFSSRLVLASLAILVVVGVSGGTAFAAEGALPGDVLYPIKIYVNENVRAVVAVSPEAKAAWSIARIDRRLTEVEALATEDRLDADTAATIEVSIETQRAKIESVAEQLENRDDAESATRIRSSLEASLHGHGELLVRISNSIDASSGERAEAFARIMNRVAAGAEATAESRSKSEESVSRSEERLMIAAESQIKVASRTIEDVSKKIDQSKEGAETDAVLRAQSRLEDARRALEDAEGNESAGLYVEAFAGANEAVRLAGQARVLIQSAARVRIPPQTDSDDGERNSEDEAARDDRGDSDTRSERRIEELRDRARELENRSSNWRDRSDRESDDDTGRDDNSDSHDQDHDTSSVDVEIKSNVNVNSRVDFEWDDREFDSRFPF